MKKTLTPVLSLLICFSFFMSLSAQEKIKVACVGDSITFGAGIAQRELNSYPAQLAKSLGDKWEVKNFGLNGRTLLTRGDAPYVNSAPYKAALAFQPNVVIIKLGTNDSKPQNWRQKNSFINDYTQMVNSFRQLDSKPTIYLCKAVPVFPEQWGIKDSVVQYEVNPRVAHVAKKMGLPLIDLYTPLKKHPELFPDKVHPNAAGAKVMVEHMAPLLKKYGKKAPPISQEKFSAADDLVIWDDEAAYDFEVAYPVGNGRLGAMPFATFPNERILINEESIWAHTQDLYMDENLFPHLEKVKELEASGDYKAADDYFQKFISASGSKGKNPHSYQLLGWLKLNYQNTGKIKSTKRSLDLKTGIATNIYTLQDGSIITQEVFASAPENVIVINIKADKVLELEVAMDKAKVIGSDLVIASQASGAKGTKFIGRVRSPQVGQASTDGTKLSFSKSTNITLYLSASTDFNMTQSAVKLADGWQKSALEDLNKLSAKSFATIKSSAIADHQKYLNRVDADFGSTSESILRLPTSQRLARLKKGAHDDPDLMETYFQFGRYLLIASSRPGTLPANLQGLWNPYMSAPWGSDYHLNINIQMNYWAAETTNLSELHTPFFKLIRLYQPSGKDMARRLGMKGWCMGHASDLWGSARLMGVRPLWAGSFFGGQWMTFHILEHYRFTKDKQILEDNWDILSASVEFVDSWLIPGPNGTLMARPASSPENLYSYKDATGKQQKAGLNAGNSYDQFMILQVLNDYVEAAKVIGKEKQTLVKKAQSLIPKIYQPQVAKDGRLMEWRLPFEEAQPGHRHISHVIGAYPGNQINLDTDPKMRSAVLKALEGRLARGGAGTGWSRAWTIGMFARFSDAPRAYENLHGILTKSTLPNLWDNHPPFQIDGNFGSTAAVAEMLLHSHNNEIKLLPALPSQWPNGFIKGLKARGDYSVDIKWQKGQLITAQITAGKMTSGPVKISYKKQSKTINLQKGQTIQVSF
ncbi:glycoside hydrolase N-terminal domain-containing protein [Lentisphaera profundi]|uniref:Glycoside hydrolase N-terminal domain-containing protein n=1 Tax=Lentisphaera profundi TaxID=1658616 RepID=A0ABY7W316_9BACT|nr:glycoside hydrolase N-terminal domain-containing protein [Lentisphaera profundi]WDE99386.1 glycoside hydrolase N-terminal domain-containing protein [Lentisphaera profundi]